MRIHSRYADGTPVYQEQEPERLPGASRPLPDPEAIAPHSRLRWDWTNNRIYQAREFDANGYPIRDIDFTTLTAPNAAFYPNQDRCCRGTASITFLTNTKIFPRRSPTRWLVI